MGEVWRARDTRLSRGVAIKVLPEGLTSDPDRLRRFEKEAHSASSLNHPNIVTIHVIGSVDSVSFIVMELVWGDRDVALSEGENILGRDRDTVVWIDLNSVSRRHSRIRVTDGAATIEDLGSRNGTYVNGERIMSPTNLSNGDKIKIGAASLVFRCHRGLGTTQSEVSR